MGHPSSLTGPTVLKNQSRPQEASSNSKPFALSSKPPTARPTGHHPDMVAQSVAPDAGDRVTWRAQQEHAFLSDGVDDVANLLVVQQEIDDQVLLLGSLQF